MDARLRVLVVDDEEVNVETFRRVFRRDLDVTGVYNAADALAALRAGAFDAVLVDYLMPDMTGVELLAAVADLAPAAKRLLVTAFTDDARIEGAARDGTVAAVILKPWRRQEVVEVIERTVGRRAAAAAGDA